MARQAPVTLVRSDQKGHRLVGTGGGRKGVGRSGVFSLRPPPCKNRPPTFPPQSVRRATSQRPVSAQVLPPTYAASPASGSASCPFPIGTGRARRRRKGARSRKGVRNLFSVSSSVGRVAAASFPG